MDHKILELAFLRNHLASKIFTDLDKELMSKIKENISKTDSPFREIALNAINNCEQDIKKNDFKSATQEIQLIHNFPFTKIEEWDSDYFYKMELLSYLEQIEDVQRIKKLIHALSKIQ